MTRPYRRVAPTLSRPEDWTTQAACAGQANADHDPWHPIAAANAHAYDLARIICQTCPVITECREHALSVGGEQGMRGGLTPTEQQAEITRRRRLA